MEQNVKKNEALGAVARLGRQAGVLSIEMIVVLGLVILILLGVGARIATSYLSNDNASELANLTAIYGVIKDTKTTVGYGTAGTDLSASVIATGKLPTNIAIVGSTITNQFGGTYVLTSTGQGFTVADPSIPQKNCVKIASSATQSGQWASTVVNSGSSTTGPMSTATAVTSCSSATNSITFTSTY
jgi:type II secretory pathway pseudopilin PulG